MLSLINNAISESTGSTVLGIKGSRLHKICICLPEIAEQQAISKIIKSHDALVRTEEINLQKHQKLKQGLMQDLLTGKVKVNLTPAANE